MFLGGVVSIGYREATSDSATNSLLSFVLGTFIFHGVMLVLLHIFLKQHEISWSAAFGFREPRLARTMFLGALMSIIVLPVALSLAGLCEWLIRQAGYAPKLQQPVEMVMQATSIYQLIAHGIVAILFAPIVEELFFRGVLYPAVKRHADPHTALWGVSLLFAMTHMNLTAFLALAVLGTILTFLYEETRNLIAPIVAHSVFNAANFGYMVFQRYSEGAL